MPKPLVIGYHLIWTAYGHWLPNDPRGSGSKTVRTDVLKDLGELHYGRKKLQPPSSEIKAFYQHAQNLLRFPTMEFGDREIGIVAQAFSKVIEKRKYTCYACAIMADHAHLLIRKHRDVAEEMIVHLQKESCLALGAIGFGGHEHPIWTHGGWKVFLDHPDEIRRTIRYIERNPINDGLPLQKWDFVTTYDGWPLHPGHSPNSPWARRLREVDVVLSRKRP